MVNLPSGTVTFVFSDIEGSTELLKRLGDESYGTLLGTHRRLVREIFAAHEGQEIDTQGDAFFYSFVRARQAVAAAIELQRAHARESWPDGAEVRVRLGLHTGEPAVGDEGYTGLDVVRAARIAAVGTGGQVLLSDTTRAIVTDGLPDGVTLRSLGDQRLKDIDRPEPLHELVIDDAPAKPAQPRPASELDEQLSRPMRSFFERTRQTIEARVLASLEDSLGGVGLPGPHGPPGPGSGQPPKPRRRSMSREIARLQALREDGALSDEQYARAVDRILAEETRSEG